MAPHVTVEDWRDLEGSYVVDVTIRRTDDETYPCGWDDSLHLGEVGDDAVLRYDNAHGGGHRVPRDVRALRTFRR